MSTAILKLSENGDLQRIHDKWLMKRACTSQGATLEIDRLPLKSFWGLFTLCGLACLLALFIYFIQMIRQFSRHKEELQSSDGSLQSGRLQKFLSFVDEKEDELKSRLKRKQSERSSNRSVGDESMNDSKEAYAESSSSRNHENCNNA